MHERGKVHQNIKPDSIIIMNQGSLPVLKLFDFSRTRDRDDDDDSAQVKSLTLSMRQQMSFTNLSRLPSCRPALPFSPRPRSF